MKREQQKMYQAFMEIESEKIADKWNDFLIEAQKSANAFVYILNYIVVLPDDCEKNNKMSFKEMLDRLEHMHKKGIWKQFVK